MNLLSVYRNWCYETIIVTTDYINKFSIRVNSDISKISLKGPFVTDANDVDFYVSLLLDRIAMQVAERSSKL